ncbi:MAG: hypothetical protein A3B89_00735 [Candidatus Buchananbacteria bacterium RIFCSPHIGHO2_02_FULL_40_13]|uniref:Uncharacterized protein n=1 Tax=Candidatus Buchananbacteria bacterium RIFCSPLOWO2_01_FULL_39_33 TaxID=1797543 RepID=A0A1G1YGV7_9BACT|nr:MAG: hypothetical protein A2820_00795 [Candidatus Buchananbacteria bacterium RIFCSPHIGHO2_01_FULL_40_35]OGY50400.1 MAG: hypothetical protein A3B89_00735 [Candidatus Buchananbacteria bacterium RIFCSPHIGHO2_02_FULL_40_13]OGY51539.1 MAG: hypothetical protein A3A02_01890 [Candidatus Buchananbacteria bacterium RIFCSPLOWO2_01_FULL_39_33]
MSTRNHFPKRYIITAAQAFGGGGKGTPNLVFLAGLKKYCEVRDAELVILPMAGSSVRELDLHPNLADRPEICFGSRPLNEKIAISDMVVPPQNVDPSSGRLRFPQRDKTLILAHPKQRLKAVPNSNYKIPKFLVSTGALTTPNYNEMNHRGDAAKRDHVYGALVVEIVGTDRYHFRHIRAGTNGAFVDLGIKFDGEKKPVPVVVEALVLGDIHVGDTDPVVRTANYQMIQIYHPKRLVLHDLFNGHSINHHNFGKLITRVQDIENGRANLAVELRQCYNELCEFAKAMGKGREVIVVACNHHQFLNRFLEEVRLMSDPLNAKTASRLMAPMVDGLDPVEVGLSMIGKIPKNVKFLDYDDDYKVRGVQLGSHGDKGMSGGRSSIRSREYAHGKSITGHSHTPEILRNTYIVGTSTFLRLPYTKGSASSWMNTNAILYDNGSVQLLNIIDGRWTT